MSRGIVGGSDSQGVYLDELPNGNPNRRGIRGKDRVPFPEPSRKERFGKNHDRKLRVDDYLANWIKGNRVIDHALAAVERTFVKHRSLNDQLVRFIETLKGIDSKAQVLRKALSCNLIFRPGGILEDVSKPGSKNRILSITMDVKRHNYNVTNKLKAYMDNYRGKANLTRKIASLGFDYQLVPRRIEMRTGRIEEMAKEHLIAQGRSNKHTEEEELAIELADDPVAVQRKIESASLVNAIDLFSGQRSKVAGSEGWRPKKKRLVGIEENPGPTSSDDSQTADSSGSIESMRRLKFTRVKNKRETNTINGNAVVGASIAKSLEGLSCAHATEVATVKPSDKINQDTADRPRLGLSKFVSGPMCMDEVSRWWVEDFDGNVISTRVLEGTRWAWWQEQPDVGCATVVRESMIDNQADLRVTMKLMRALAFGFTLLNAVVTAWTMCSRKVQYKKAIYASGVAGVCTLAAARVGLVYLTKRITLLDFEDSLVVDRAMRARYNQGCVACKMTVSNFENVTSEEDVRAPSWRQIKATHNPVYADVLVEKVIIKPLWVGKLSEMFNPYAKPTMCCKHSVVQSRRVDVRTINDSYFSYQGDLAKALSIYALRHQKNIGANTCELSDQTASMGMLMVCSMLKHELSNDYETWRHLKCPVDGAVTGCSTGTRTVTML